MRTIERQWLEANRQLNDELWRNEQQKRTTFAAEGYDPRAGIEVRARFRDEIHAAADSIDRSAGVDLGTTLNGLLRAGFLELHDAEVDQLQAMLRSLRQRQK